MNLKDYLQQNNMSIAAFAQMSDFSRVYVSQIINGRRPGKKFARRINELTHGCVWFDLNKNQSKEKTNVS